MYVRLFLPLVLASLQSCSTSYIRPTTHPGYENSNNPIYDSSGYNSPIVGSSGYDIPGYNSPGYDSPVVGSPGYDSPVVGSSGYDIPGYNSPGYDSPIVGSPGYDIPGYYSPGHYIPGYNSPGFDIPGYNSTGYDSPGFDSPGYDSPGYDSPGYDSPGYDSPVYENKYDEEYTPRDPLYWSSNLFLDAEESHKYFGPHILPLRGETTTHFKKRQECQRKKMVLSESDMQCYRPLDRGPCEKEEVFFALRSWTSGTHGHGHGHIHGHGHCGHGHCGHIQGHGHGHGHSGHGHGHGGHGSYGMVRQETYQGECRRNDCYRVGRSFIPSNIPSNNGSCVDVTTECNAGMQLYYNRFGGTDCGCMKGLMFDGHQCFNEFSHGNCPYSRFDMGGQITRRRGTWRKIEYQEYQNWFRPHLPWGYCKIPNMCSADQIEWEDRACYRLGNVMETGQCNGTIIKSFNELVCEPNTGEQLEYLPTSILIPCGPKYTKGEKIACFQMELKPSCRKGFVYNLDSNKCKLEEYVPTPILPTCETIYTKGERVVQCVTPNMGDGYTMGEYMPSCRKGFVYNSHSNKCKKDYSVNGREN